VTALRAAAAAHLSPAGQLQVATALEMAGALESRLHALRHQLTDVARHLTGAKVLAARLYGVGPVTALAMTCWLAGAGRFSSSRKAVSSGGGPIGGTGVRLPGRQDFHPARRWLVIPTGAPGTASTARLSGPASTRPRSPTRSLPGR
jgi:transposase